MTKRLYFWLGMCAAFFVFLFLIRSILLPFILGILTAYFLDPAADRLEKIGCSRSRATLIVTACFFCSMVLLSLLIVPLLASQLAALITAMPGYMVESGHHFLPMISYWVGSIPLLDMDGIKSTLADFSGTLVRMLGGFIAGIFQSGMAFINLLSLILVTPIVAFYLLEEWDRIIARIDSWLPRQHADTIRNQIVLIDRMLAGFVRGQLNVCLILSTYYTLALEAAGLHFSSVIGIATGLLVIVPYVGWMLGASVGLAVAFFQFDSIHFVGIVAAIFIIGMIVEGNFLTPTLVGKRVGLHPVWIIFGLLSGAALFGFVGVLLAVPVSAVVGVLVRFALGRYLQSEYYRGTAV